MKIFIKDRIIGELKRMDKRRFVSYTYDPINGIITIVVRKRCVRRSK
jgi:hypothetical protein